MVLLNSSTATKIVSIRWKYFTDMIVFDQQMLQLSKMFVMLLIEHMGIVHMYSVNNQAAPVAQWVSAVGC